MTGAHNRVSHNAEVFVGRVAAIVVHPFAAWRSRSGSDRALLVISYFAMSYAIVFALLQAISA